ncbi:MAG: flagellar type III secretion system pore protein FliP, partial [Rhodospirillales bacterium]|nr:flagellar type III secretion system pore protein FliP [Rhodospirillales bacterium]
MSPAFEQNTNRNSKRRRSLKSAVVPFAGALAACLCLGAVLMWLVSPAAAQSLSLNLGGDGAGGESTARLIQIMALVTVLSLAPSILIMMTSFVRIMVVLSFLRTALGTQQTPPNQVLVSLALFLTLFVMMPTFEATFTQGIKPLIEGDIEEAEAFKRSVQPFQKFMSSHVREQDIALFLEIAKIPELKDSAEMPLQVLIPAFMISELRRAFEIGFLIFVPFLIIDMVVASVLMSMGMMM